MKVVVTGANGFLGYYVVRQFVAAGWQVVGIGSSSPSADLVANLHSYQRWLLPDKRLLDLLRDLAPQVLVHCAGRASVPLSFAEPAQDFAAGPSLLFDVLDQVRQGSPATRVLFLSSAAVYGHPPRLPIAEDQQLAPSSPYGFHKELGERLCSEFTKLFGVPTASLRLFSAYGPGLRRQVLWDLCQKASQDQEILVQGTGDESRDFIHATDVARAVYQLAVAAPLQGEAYNVASGRETPIAMVAAKIVDLLAPGKPWRFNGVLPPGTPRHWRADIRRLGQLGFVPARNLQEGIADYVAWYRQEVCQRAA